MNGIRDVNDIEKIYVELQKLHKSSDSTNWVEVRCRINEMITTRKFFVRRRRHIVEKIEKFCGENRDIKILDFGCGGGQTLFCLRILGYKWVYGVDVSSQIGNNVFMKNLGLNDVCCFEYDKKRLPFREESFDFVISEQVLEHVHDIPLYYQECARVLKKGGIAYVSFPHRLIPFDSHSRTWFIHYFPPAIQRFLFKIAKRDPDYFAEILNLRTIRHHKGIALQFFDKVTDETRERLSLFNNQDLSGYEGNRFLRKLADKMIKSKIFGPVALPIFCKISNVDLCFFKF